MLTWLTRPCGWMRKTGKGWDADFEIVVTQNQGCSPSEKNGRLGMAWSVSDVSGLEADLSKETGMRNMPGVRAALLETGVLVSRCRAWVRVTLRFLTLDHVMRTALRNNASVTGWRKGDRDKGV